MTTHIWLRAESKPNEQRTALTPASAERLLNAGFHVTVERSRQSAFRAEDYEAVGCAIVPEHRWQTDAPQEALILGLKELRPGNEPLIHRHIHFAHVYKEQSGWQGVLSRFVRGGGALLDLEFLVDESGRRVAAFGYWAGYAGAALAVLGWAAQQLGDDPILEAVKSRGSQVELLADVRSALDRVGRSPTAMVIGALGRSGRGACELFTALGIESLRWDLEETKQGGPFAETLQFDILINCVFVQAAVPPFVTAAMLKSAKRQLSLICDVSCDPYGECNPLPIYDKCTTFQHPAQRLVSGERPLDLIAIDHLPSLLPVESSEDFCTQLLPYLLQLDDFQKGVWQRALALYKEKSQLAAQVS
jgi:saccharopine dehydrogenase (NAD+, L-lysine-forming)